MNTFEPVTKNPIFNIIRVTHGARILKLARLFEQTNIKITKTLGFNLTWPHFGNMRTSRILKEAGFALLRTTIREHRKNICLFRTKLARAYGKPLRINIYATKEHSYKKVGEFVLLA
uniref:Uncharacterized protein n=1 Tax=Trichuris muris TaxID=70415 RepID=A0A5S6QV15_TRIMR